MRCRRSGGFPKSLYYDSYDDKIVYTSSVINQIFEKDIKTSTKIKDKAFVLEKAKIIYSCELFDIKSKIVLKGEKKYYLADLSIYFAMNTDNRINYGPVLENVMYSYLKSKNYRLSVGYIGKLECYFIARANYDDYYYIQVCKYIGDNDDDEYLYRPFYMIRNFYPRYLFTMDMSLQKRDEINHVNIADFIYNNSELHN